MVPSKKNQNKKKVMDVLSPGSTKPSENSKNIIIKSNPILIDPMISDNHDPSLESDRVDQEEPLGPPDLPKTLSRKINIEPLRDNIKDDIETKDEPETLLAPSEHEKSKLNIVVPDDDLKTQANEDLNASNEETDRDNLKLPIEDHPQDATKDQETNDSKPESYTLNQASDKPNVDQSDISTPEISNIVGPQSNQEDSSKDFQNEDATNSLINKKQVNESSEEKVAQLKEAEEQKRLQEINRMIESKQYFLPINRTQKKKTKRFVILGTILSIILIIAWLFIASNAGLIKI